MSDLIIGYGEIGKAVHKLIPEAKIKDLIIKNRKVGSVEVMHICFPYSDKFIKNVWDYIGRYQPKYIAIWSTVPIGTTRKVNSKAIHTPVEGKHPRLAKSIKYMPRWIGYNNKGTARFFDEYFRQLKLKTRLVNNTDTTEVLKLLSTTEYGLNIEFARYKKQVLDTIKVDFEWSKQWNKDYNQLYKELGLSQFQKFILDAPEGIVGGHCILPNYHILYEQHPDTLLGLLIYRGEIE